MTAVAESWKAHVLECGLCSSARAVTDICPVGRTFWPEPVVAAPVVAAPVVAAPVVAAPVVAAPVVAAAPAERPVAPAGELVVLMPGNDFIKSIADRVSKSVVARSSTGASVIVPMEKTSAAVEIRTSRDVLLRMPERDIDVYGAMRNAIRVIATLAEKLGKMVMVVEETKRHIRTASNVKEAPEEQVSLVIAQVTGQFGTSEDELYGDFDDTCRMLFALGDKIGSFMTVDDDTRRVMQSARSVGIEMKGELERSYDGKLPLDIDMRKLIRLLRLLAMDLQGEIERRLGSC